MIFPLQLITVFDLPSYTFAIPVFVPNQKFGLDQCMSASIWYEIEYVNVAKMGTHNVIAIDTFQNTRMRGSVYALDDHTVPFYGHQSTAQE